MSEAAAEVGIAPGLGRGARDRRAPRRGRARWLTALRAVPAWAWLAAIVAPLVRPPGLARARDARRRSSWSTSSSTRSSAKSFAADLALRRPRRRRRAGYGAVYPILIAPAYALFDRIPDAYAAVKTINSLVMSLAAVPAYCIARRVVGKWLALLAAVLAVAVPSMVYTATVMTENAYYPVFLLAALALVRAARAPDAAQPRRSSSRRSGSRYLTRSQAVVLAAGGASPRRSCSASFDAAGFRATLWPYRLAVRASSSAARVLVVAAQVARGRPLSALLGAYAVVGDGQLRPRQGAALRRLPPAELDLYLGVIPVAAAIVLTARARSLDRPLQVLLAVTSRSRSGRASSSARSRRGSPTGSRSGTCSRRAAVPDPPARLGRARRAAAARRRDRGGRGARRCSSSRSRSSASSRPRPSRTR